MQLKKRKSKVNFLNPNLLGGLCRSLLALLISLKCPPHLLFDSLGVCQGLYVSQNSLKVPQTLLVRLGEPAELLKESNSYRSVLFQFDLAFGFEAYLVVTRAGAVLVLFCPSTETL